jgi:hypothetical protein
LTHNNVKGEGLMKRRALLVAVSAAVLALGSMKPAVAVPVLSVDLGHLTPAATPVQPGFTGIAGPSSEASHTEAVGAFSVTVEGE